MPRGGTGVGKTPPGACRPRACRWRGRFTSIAQWRQHRCSPQVLSPSFLSPSAAPRQKKRSGRAQDDVDRLAFDEAAHGAGAGLRAESVAGSSTAGKAALLVPHGRAGCADAGVRDPSSTAVLRGTSPARTTTPAQTVCPFCCAVVFEQRGCNRQGSAPRPDMRKARRQGRAFGWPSTRVQAVPSPSVEAKNIAWLTAERTCSSE